MDIEITLKNYRSFADANPATLRLRRGFSAFVGKNNSGKSTLVRVLYELRGLFSELGLPGHLSSALTGNPVQFALPIPDPAALACDFNDRLTEVSISYADPQWTIGTIPQRIVLRFTDRHKARVIADLYGPDGNKVDTSSHFTIKNDEIQTKHVTLDFASWQQVCSLLVNSLYIGAFRNVINVGGNAEYYDIAVGQEFVRQWRAQQTGPNRFARESIYRLTDSIRRIFEFDDLEIHSAEDGQTLRIMIDGKGFDLSDVGAGITQFILVLGNAAIKHPAFILVDEPELNLHASLQSDFLTTLGTFASEGVVFATHNYGLARSSADWIWAVRKNIKEPSMVTPLEDVKALSEFVGALSFSGSPELGFNRILLVEGPSEVRAIQQWLRFYKKEHQVLLLPLGGGSLINGSQATEVQLQELFRITNAVSAMVDSEKPAAGAPLDASRTAFHALCGKVGITCHVLDRRALENYFPQAAIEKAIGPGRTSLGPYDALAATGPGWSKRDNWKITREMTAADLSGTDVETFLMSL